MIKIVGLHSKKIYAEGSRAECSRQLLEKYPTKNDYQRNSTGKTVKVSKDYLYPEPLKVVIE